MKVDIIFFVMEKLEIFLIFLGIEYIFYEIVKLYGYVFIGFIDKYNVKVRDLVLEVFYDFWFIFLLIFFFVGIVGICIWVLV